MYVQTARKPRLELLTAVRLLDLVKVFSPVLPEIEFPDEKISLDEKVIFTIGAGLLFILSHLPIYGLIKDAPLKMTDPFPALRPLYAMEQGTLLELGLLPVITAAFVWQIAAGLRMVKVNLSYSQERELFQSAQKLTSFTLAVVFGVALVFSGYYEPVVRGAGSAVSWTTYVLILTQIVGWNFLLTLIVEVIDKGYGFGSGIVCLLSLNAATRLVRDVVGLEMVSTVPGGKPETYGVAIYLIKALFSFDLTTIKNAVIGVFSRAGFPTIGQVILALVTGLATIVLQNFRVELPIRSNKARGTANVFPIRLLYTGALPVLFAFTVLANAQVTLHFASVFVEPFYPLVAHLFESRSETGKVVSGLAFYISAPASFTESLLSPIRGVVYTSLILVLSAVFGRFWSGISGSAPKDIAQTFKDQGIVIAGRRDVSVTKELAKIIPVASQTGAVVLAALALVGELTGSRGRTVALTVGVCGAFSVLEDFMTDYQQSGGASQIMSSLGGYQ